MVPGRNGACQMGQQLKQMTRTPKKPKPKKKLKARITYLEMTQHFSRHIPVPSKPAIALIRAKNVPLEYYRYIYTKVGGKHHWTDRLKLSDKKLDAIINAEMTEISILYVEGCPAGYFEINNANLPESAELAYFGMCEPYIGIGLGKWFLSKILVHTNTLDHPAALPLYQKLGFTPYAFKDTEITPFE